MTSNRDNLPPLVKEITEMRITGNVIPHKWLKLIVSGKKEGTDYPACFILSDICYWYRALETRDEHTGVTIRVQKRFKADKLQRSYAQIAEKLNHNKKRIKQAVDLLIELGLITREFRTVESTVGSPQSNVMFLEPVPDKIREFSRVESEELSEPAMPKIYNSSEAVKTGRRSLEKDSPTPEKRGTPSPQKRGGRIQGSTTETTTERKRSFYSTGVELKDSSSKPKLEDCQTGGLYKAVDPGNKPKLEDCQPGDLHKAVEQVNSLKLSTRAEKCEVLETIFPVMDLVGSCIERMVPHPRHLTYIWNRIRNGDPNSTLPVEDLFVYAAQGRFCELKFQGGLREFIKEHETNKEHINWARDEVSLALEAGLMQYTTTGVFPDKAAWMDYALKTYGRFLVDEFINPGWWDDYARECKV